MTPSRDGKHTGVVPFLIDWGATAHPSASLPQVALCAFEAVHPDPAVTSARLGALAVDLTVRPGLRPGLIATLDGPNGTLTLL